MIAMIQIVDMNNKIQLQKHPKKTIDSKKLGDALKRNIMRRKQAKNIVNSPNTKNSPAS